MSQHFFQYSQRLTLCMLRYQYIEFELKGCLIRYHATVMYRLAGYLPYEVPLDEIEGAALGRLAKWFKSYSSNRALLGSLNKVKNERDHIAHVGFIFTREEQADDTHVLEKLKELEAAHQRADECLAMLFLEHERAEDVVQRAYADLRARSQAEGKSPVESFAIPSRTRPPESGP